MAAVTIAVQRVGVRRGGVLGGILGTGVIVVAYEIRAALDLRRIRAEQRRIGGGRAGPGRRPQSSRGGGAAAGRLRENDPPIEGGDPGVVTLPTRRAPPPPPRAREKDH